jgi:hypothetical protein
MRGLWALCLGLAAAASAACSSADVHPREPRPAPPNAIPISGPQTYSEEADKKKGRKWEGGLEEICKIDPASCPNLDMEKEAGRKFNEPLYAVAQVYGYEAGSDPLNDIAGAIASANSTDEPLAQKAPLPAPSAIPVKPTAAARPELFDIEAKVEIRVADLERARAKLAELTRSAGGQLMNEAVAKSDQSRGASLSLRIPSDGVHTFLGRLREVGEVFSSNLVTNEVSRKIADAEVLERNLEQTLRRYEELLAKATNVAETIQVEAELARVRTALDRVRGDLAWAKDRVARSTVYVTLSLEPENEPQRTTAKLHPGLRAALFYDVLPSGASEPSTAYAGGGLSIAWPRAFSLDLDLLTSLSERRGDAIDFYIVTLGTDLYSDFLGRGTRSTLNPYVGFRTGFAHAPSQSLWPVGVTLGLDLYKSKAVLFAFEVRSFALMGRKDGVDFGLEPAFGLNVAY